MEGKANLNDGKRSKLSGVFILRQSGLRKHEN
jgi:hypothetical protein